MASFDGNSEESLKPLLHNLSQVTESSFSSLPFHSLPSVVQDQALIARHINKVLQEQDKLQKRINTLTQDIQDVKEMTRRRLEVTSLGIVITSEIGRSVVEKKRMTVTVQVINRNGEAQGLDVPVECQLTIEEFTHTRHRGNSCTSVFLKTWNSTMDSTGRAEFVDVLVPEFFTYSRKSVTITVTCSGPTRIAALVIDDLPVSKVSVEE